MLFCSEPRVFGRRSNHTRASRIGEDDARFGYDSGPISFRILDSMSKQRIHTEGAPAAIGTYSPAVWAGEAVYPSGQIGLDPAFGERVEIDAILHVAGAGGGHR